MGVRKVGESTKVSKTAFVKRDKGAQDAWKEVNDKHLGPQVSREDLDERRSLLAKLKIKDEWVKYLSDNFNFNLASPKVKDKDVYAIARGKHTESPYMLVVTPKVDGAGPVRVCDFLQVNFPWKGDGRIFVNTLACLPYVSAGEDRLEPEEPVGKETLEQLSSEQVQELRRIGISDARLASMSEETVQDMVNGFPFFVNTQIPTEAGYVEAVGTARFITSESGKMYLDFKPVESVERKTGERFNAEECYRVGPYTLDLWEKDKNGRFDFSKPTKALCDLEKYGSSLGLVNATVFRDGKSNFCKVLASLNEDAGRLVVMEAKKKPVLREDGTVVKRRDREGKMYEVSKYVLPLRSNGDSVFIEGQSKGVPATKEQLDTLSSGGVAFFELEERGKGRAKSKVTAAVVVNPAKGGFCTAFSKGVSQELEKMLGKEKKVSEKLSRKFGVSRKP